MSEEYSIYSKFDIIKHKETYINYLEVVITENGEVLYAIPSHQEALIKLAMNKLQCTRQEVINKCPPEYYYNYIEWLSIVSGAIAVWNTAYMGKPNKKQLSVLKKLKINGIYNGPVT